MKLASAVAAFSLVAFASASPFVPVIRRGEQSIDNSANLLAACTSTIGIGINIGGGVSGSVSDTDPNFDFFSFCKQFLQATGVVTKTVQPTSYVSITVSTTKTVSVFTTTYLPATGTAATVYCAIPSAGATCALNGWGYATNNIYSVANTTAEACHQLCLLNAQCMSYQTGSDNSCNLYKVNASGNNTIAGAAPYFFNDRDCPNDLPAGCSGQSSPPGVTTLPPTTPPSTPPKTTTVSVPSNPPAVPPKPVTTSTISVVPPVSIGPIIGERDVEAAAYTIPFFLTGLGTAALTSVCDCLITTPIPTLYSTVTLMAAPTTVSATISSTKLTTTTATITAGGSGPLTTYISVS